MISRPSAKGIYRLMRQLFECDNGGTKTAFSRNNILIHIKETFPNANWRDDIYNPFMVKGWNRWLNYKNSKALLINQNEENPREEYGKNFQEFLENDFCAKYDRDVKGYRLPINQEIFDQLNSDDANRHLDTAEDKILNILVKGGKPKIDQKDRTFLKFDDRSI